MAHKAKYPFGILIISSDTMFAQSIIQAMGKGVDSIGERSEMTQLEDTWPHDHLLILVDDQTSFLKQETIKSFIPARFPKQPYMLFTDHPDDYSGWPSSEQQLINLLPRNIP